MKNYFILVFLLLSSTLAQAQVDDKNFFGAGLRLGVGYNFINYEQRISDTGTDFTTSAQDVTFLHISFMHQWDPQWWFLMYGSIGSVTFDSKPTSSTEQHSALTADLNLETRFSWDEVNDRESWVPMYIVGVNATDLTLARAPRSLASGYEYDQILLISPVIGVTTTAWGNQSAWRNTVRLSVPLFAGSGVDVRSGFNLSGLTSYTFELGRYMTMGLEGQISYSSLKLTEVSPVTGLDVNHEITQFSLGPRIFFTIGF